MMLPVAHKLPEFWTLAKEIASGLGAGIFTDWDSLLQRMNPMFTREAIGKIDKAIPGWRKIATLHRGQTAKHTLLVLATCLTLPEYVQADAQTQVEIEWAAVLHDLDKDRARNDTAHPFRSAAVVAKIMPELGFELLPTANQTDVEAWSTLVRSAQRPDGERMIHDHSSLKEIIEGIYNCWGKDTSAARILKAVLLHQSLPTVSEWRNPVLLTDEELSFALRLKDMKVLGTLMLADSDSWSIFDSMRTSYLDELRANNAETCGRIQNAGK